MSKAQILNSLNPRRTGLRHMLFACTVLALAAAPLHGQKFHDLHDFHCNNQGCNPTDYGYLTQGMDNNLYGTTSFGGSHGAGTIFRVTLSSPPAYADLYEFDGTTAGDPQGGLTLAGGNYYGTTYSGGTYDLGTIFVFNPSNKPPLKVLYSFNGTDSEDPEAPPVLAKDGNLYGFALTGAPYRVTLPAETVTPLSSTAPGEIYDPLFLAADGYLYGTSATGGTSGLGTVFRMSTTGAIDILYNFTGVGTDGATPMGPLTQALNGVFYGTTSTGGSSNMGVVFAMSVSAGKATVKTLYSFNPSTDGEQPRAGLLAGADGFLYGVNPFGGADDSGTIYQISKAGFFNKLFDFTDGVAPAPGKGAFATLMAHTNGTYYGLTGAGGASNSGVVYGLTPAKPILSLIVEGPIFVLPGVPVEILGNNLAEVSSLSFAGVPAQFQPGSNTYLTAIVPSAAVDGFVTATFPSGLQIQSQSKMHILPLVTNLDPTSGPVGTQVGIVGGGFAGANKVTFGGVKATSFTVVSPTLIQAIVPTGAKTGKVSVSTHNGNALSKETFTVN
jgi:uncharacterized repeat protein (TIGR03803 family)